MIKTNNLGIIQYYTKTKPINAKRKNPKDFIVLELSNKKATIKNKKLKDYFFKQKKNYVQFTLVKKQYTTNKIVKKLSNIMHSKIYYNGLKDKNAITSQFMQVKANKFKPVNGTDFHTHSYSNTNKKKYLGNLVGNEFIITLHHNENENKINNFLNELKQKKYELPNYFAEQRFGNEEKNHVIGKHLFKQEYEKAFKLVKNNHVFNKNEKFVKHAKKQEYKKAFKNINKRFLSLFYHAYQSFIFNHYLSEQLLDKNKQYIKNIIHFTPKNKEIKRIRENLGVKKLFGQTIVGKLKGFKRQTFMRLNNFKTINKKPLVINFWLEKNCYATNLLREIKKGEN